MAQAPSSPQAADSQRVRDATAHLPEERFGPREPAGLDIAAREEHEPGQRKADLDPRTNLLDFDRDQQLRPEEAGRDAPCAPSRGRDAPRSAPSASARDRAGEIVQSVLRCVAVVHDGAVAARLREQDAPRAGAAPRRADRATRSRPACRRPSSSGVPAGWSAEHGRQRDFVAEPAQHPGGVGGVAAGGDAQRGGAQLLRPRRGGAARRTRGRGRRNRRQRMRAIAGVFPPVGWYQRRPVSHKAGGCGGDSRVMCSATTGGGCVVHTKGAVALGKCVPPVIRNGRHALKLGPNAQQASEYAMPPLPRLEYWPGGISQSQWSRFRLDKAVAAPTEILPRRVRMDIFATS